MSLNFNENFHVYLLLESTSHLVEGRYGNTNSKVIYGVFTTPTNSISGSAVCAFSLQVRIEDKMKNYKLFFTCHALTLAFSLFIFLNKIFLHNIRCALLQSTFNEGHSI